MNPTVILLDDGWKKLKEGGVQKIEEILEDMQDGVYKHRITTDEYSQLYTCAPHRARRAPCCARRSQAPGRPSTRARAREPRAARPR